jgi:WD40 repeat protein
MWAYADHIDKVIRLHDTRSGTEIRQLKGHESAPQAVGFSPAGKLLASTDGDHLYFWDPATGKQSGKSGQFSAFQQLTFSPDGKFLTGDGAGPTPNLYDLAAGKKRYPGSQSYSAPPAVFSPDGRWVAAAQSHIIQVWDMVREKPVGPTGGHVGVSCFPHGRQLEAS